MGSKQISAYQSRKKGPSWIHFQCYARDVRGSHTIPEAHTRSQRLSQRLTHAPRGSHTLPDAHTCSQRLTHAPRDSHTLPEAHTGSQRLTHAPKSENLEISCESHISFAYQGPIKTQDRESTANKKTNIFQTKYHARPAGRAWNSLVEKKLF